MEKIKSFTVNHLKLNCGLYVSRIDNFDGVTLTTFDMRFTAPNKEEVMPSPAIHTIEHLGATFFRNGSFKEKVVYFGPMGCRTGFYLILAGNPAPEDILDEVKKMLAFIIDFKGEIFGATPIECGNYSEQDLVGAKGFAQKYLTALTEKLCTKYSE